MCKCKKGLIYQIEVVLTTDGQELPEMVTATLNGRCRRCSAWHAGLDEAASEHGDGLWPEHLVLQVWPKGVAPTNVHIIAPAFCRSDIKHAVARKYKGVKR